jgi:hypothetical protein
MVVLAVYAITTMARKRVGAQEREEELQAA